MKLDPHPDRFETACGLIISVIASFLAILQTSGDNYKSETLKAVNEKAQAYQWQQSKSIKQNLVEGQVAIIEILVQSKVIQAKDTAVLNKNLDKLRKRAARYEKDKDEILRGSEAVGKENWTQEINGKFGGVIGAKEWEKTIDYYDKKNDRADLASIFLQIGIVIGGLSLILQEHKLKLGFFYTTITLGTIGFILGLYALFS